MRKKKHTICCLKNPSLPQGNSRFLKQELGSGVVGIQVENLPIPIREQKTNQIIWKKKIYILSKISCYFYKKIIEGIYYIKVNNHLMVHASAPPTLTAPGSEATARVAAAVAAPLCYREELGLSGQHLQGSNQL